MKRRLFSLVVVMLAVGCGDSTSPTVGPPTSIAVVTGNNQTHLVGRPLPEPLVVWVQDSNGNPVPGQSVAFSVVAGGGSVLAGSIFTDNGGEARDQWTLGTVVGNQAVEVRVRTLPDI